MYAEKLAMLIDGEWVGADVRDSIPLLNPATGEELGRCVEDIGKGHAERLMAVIGEAMEQADVGYRDLSAIAVSIGPGSFTGIRVGVAAARGLALALDVPAHGVPTLSAIAEEARARFPTRRILASIDAKRDELYVEDHAADGGLRLGPAVVRRTEAAAILDGPPLVLAGSGAACLAEIAQASGLSFDMAGVGTTADIGVYARLAAQGRTFNSPPKPLYLRGPDARPQGAYALPRA